MQNASCRLLRAVEARFGGLLRVEVRLQQDQRGRGPREWAKRKHEELTWDLVWFFFLNGAVVGAAATNEDQLRGIG